MEYRRHLKSQTWHFCRDCSQWPSEFNIILLEQLQPDWQLCSECIALEQQKQSSEKSQDK
jgi:hypothetical protein